MTSTTDTPAVTVESTETVTHVAPGDTPLVPATPKSTGRRVQSDAAKRGRAAAAKVKATKAAPKTTKPAAKRAPKVATPKPAVKVQAANVADRTRQHPFQGNGTLVIVGKVGDPLSGKVVFVGSEPNIAESMAQALAAGKVTQEQVDTGAAYCAPLRNLWQRI